MDLTFFTLHLKKQSLYAASCIQSYLVYLKPWKVASFPGKQKTSL
ncbi:hypothetical protein D932_03193 [Enterococcus casseliflavus 14-MB-W-14]|nr:hypothetical protein D932_03193 [Enterococcus casseliflavus 14-MB-W-14]